MGVYTGVRCKILVKEAFREDIKRVLSRKLEAWEYCEHPILKEFSDVESSFNFPYGDICFMSGDWENEDFSAKDGFELSFYEETGYWSFQCCVNYGGYVIDYLLDKMIPLIAEKVIHLEILYEDSERGSLYTLSEGVCTEQGYIAYDMENEAGQYICIGLSNCNIEQDDSRYRVGHNFVTEITKPQLLD